MMRRKSSVSLSNTCTTVLECAQIYGRNHISILICSYQECDPFAVFVLKGGLSEALVNHCFGLYPESCVYFDCRGTFGSVALQRFGFACSQPRISTRFCLRNLFALCTNALRKRSTPLSRYLDIVDWCCEAVSKFQGQVSNHERKFSRIFFS